MRVISMFDWNGSTKAQMVDDAKKFNFVILNEAVQDMGFIEYCLEGTDEDLDAFYEYYDLGDDD